ncbi:flagellar basal body-associated FliL family protein [Limnobacter humi]|uniref:Flagellar protein FliL n=1 Tax=Limnobacter humi TaxID=1778671 RepID=A0ABT1WJR7_9BURK|nr:flagellar basal body-associated FliL family protein [Limnobacter humi]MCQ8897761.1 flagellar basal body-associated FliL family protein [Limnobacter humi]
MAKVAAVPAKAGAEEAQAPAAGSKKKLIIMVAVALLVLIAGGAGAFFMLKGGEHKGEEAAKEEKPHGPPAFVVMDPFVVNLAAPDSTRYLQIGITYETTGPLIAEEIKTFTPVIRSRILMVLSSKNVSQLTTIEGKQALMDELVDLARVTIKGDVKDPTHGIRDVHFSSFVIQ